MDVPRNKTGVGRLWNRRRFLQAGGAAAFGGVFYAWRIEPHWVEFTRRSLPLTSLPPSLEGAKLVQLSDIHVGEAVDSSYLIDVMRRVAALDPEIVVFTGDFVTHSRPEVIDELGRVFEHVPHGSLHTVGSLGNHDYGMHDEWPQERIARAVSERARDAGIALLRNECIEVAGLHIVGADDLWSGNFNPRKALQKLPEDSASVVLSHNPDTADRRRAWGEYRGWILAGHTHGGQIKPPFLPPPVLPVSNRRYTAGEYDVGEGRFMYVNRGVGHSARVRFNARPEVTVFTLRSA